MPIKYGSTRVNDVFHGSQRVLQVYHGSNLVYNASVGLPEGYVGLEYIEANNGQYIDTGVLYNNVSKAKVEAKMVSYGGSGYPTILGCAISNPATYGVIIGVGPNVFYEQTGSGGNGYIYHSYPFDLNKHTFTTDLVNKTMTIDDTMDTFEHDKTSIDLNVYLLRRNIDGNTLGLACMCRCYSCKLWNSDNKIIANMIPAMRCSDGTVGMYDLHRRKFLTNAGTGDFIAGPIVKNLPSRYIEVDYLESDSTAYIDTGINGGVDTLEITGTFSYSTHVNYGAIYGNYVSDAHNGIRNILHSANDMVMANNNTICTTTGNTLIDCTINTKHTVVNNHAYVISDGVKTDVTMTATGTTNNNKIALFNRSLTNPITRNIGLKVYEFYVKQNNSYLQYLVPVFDTVENEYCMYDLVTRTAFRNVGTGAFTGGEIYTDYIGLSNVASIGEKYMNTGIIPNQDYSMELEYEPTTLNTQVFAGTRNVNPDNNSFHINIGSSSQQMYAFDGVSASTGVAASLYKHKFYLTKNKATYDEVDYTFSSSNFQSTTPIFLFGCSSNNMLILSSKAKIYHCKIWNGKTLVADYLPVTKKSTNEEGFINKVDQSFITWGAEIPTIPSEYLLQDYITFNGSSNYVDTEIVPTDVTNIEVNVRAKANVINNFSTVYGFMNTSSSVTPRMGLHYYSSKYMIGINNTNNGGVTSDTNWHDFKLTNNNTNTETLYVDGTCDKSSSSNNNGFSTNDLSIYLGARHQHDKTVNYFNGKIAHYSYKQNGTMIKDLYPVKRFSDLTYGFFDVINKEFLPLH